MRKKGRDDGYVVDDVTPELWDALRQIDSMRLMILEGAVQRLGPGATLAEAVAFFRDPGPEPPPDRVPRSRRRAP